MAELADAIDLGSIVNRRAGSSPVIRMMVWFSGMEKWMEVMESRMESGFWEIGRSLEALIFCCGKCRKAG